jgi:hypothetical protein
LDGPTRRESHLGRSFVSDKSYAAAADAAASASAGVEDNPCDIRGVLVIVGDSSAVIFN